MTALYLPIDEIVGSKKINYNIAADFLELAAFLSNDCTVVTSAVVNEASIGASEDYRRLDDELIGVDELANEEELLCGVIERLSERQDMVGTSYPFDVGSYGDIVTYCPPNDANDAELHGRAAYLLCLLLSNLGPISPILEGSEVHPTEDEVRSLRLSFQYFATTALAAEIQGRAWSFGFPRPDGSGFLEKLKGIWAILGDGHVHPQKGVPSRPKDDQIDVFAARLPGDKLPGFPLVAAQVATGKDYAGKSLKGYVGAFRSRWFSQQPVTNFITYMVVPFVMEPDKMTDDVRKVGNLVHRLRLAKRVAEAGRVIEDLGGPGMIEGYEHLEAGWHRILKYRQRAISAESAVH